MTDAPKIATDGAQLAEQKPGAAPESLSKSKAGRFKSVGGSMNDGCNGRLCNSALQAMWCPDSNREDACNFAGALAGIAQ